MNSGRAFIIPQITLLQNISQTEMYEYFKNCKKLACCLASKIHPTHFTGRIFHLL